MKTILLLLIICSGNAHAQTKCFAGKFDIIKFNRNKKNGIYESYLKDSTYVVQMETRNAYCENITLPDKLTQKRRTFYKGTGILKAETTSFSGFNTGVGKIYNTGGILVKEINYDSVFTFSLQNLVVKMSALGIDILNYNNKIGIFRSENPIPYYQVFCPYDSSLLYHKIYVIDGITGNTKSISKCYTPWCGNDNHNIPCEELPVDEKRPVDK